jgi:RNA polymerase sigma factor (sigma-70 family)
LRAVALESFFPIGNGLELGETGILTETPDALPKTLPTEVAALLDSSGGSARDAAWQKVVDRHSRLILSTVRALSSDYDEAMDQYAFVLDALQRDDHRRLRAYAASRAGRFEAWLVVVTRRLCVDYRRQRYGRIRESPTELDSDRKLRAKQRRQLLDLVTEELDVATTADTSIEDPEAALRRRELQRALEDAIQSLDARDRLLLRLRFEDGHAARVIGEAMGFPSTFHVYRRLKKVLAGLRRRLREAGVSDAHP